MRAALSGTLSPQEEFPGDSVFTLFTERKIAEDAVQALLADGFSGKEISTHVSRGGTWLDDQQRYSTKVIEGTAIGVFSGLFLGGIVEAIFDFSILGFNRFESIIAFACIGGMLAGVIGLIIGMGLKEYDTEKYETDLPDGRLLLQVRTRDQVANARARAILEARGGKPVVPGQVTHKAA